MGTRNQGQPDATLTPALFDVDTASADPVLLEVCLDGYMLQPLLSLKDHGLDPVALAKHMKATDPHLQSLLKSLNQPQERG